MLGMPALRSMKPWSSRSGGFTKASSSEVASRLRGAVSAIVQVWAWSEEIPRSPVASATTAVRRSVFFIGSLRRG